MAFWNKNSLDNDEPRSNNEFDGKTEENQVAAPIEDQSSNNFTELGEGKGAEKYNKIRSALGPGTVIQGKLSFDTPVRIDGKLSGEIYSSKSLIVGNTGVIEAEIHVAALIVMGVVRGNIRASEKVELLQGGELYGDVTTPYMVMEDGAFFNGCCTMQISKDLKAKSDVPKDMATVSGQGQAGQTAQNGTASTAKDSSKEVKKETELRVH